MSDDTDDIKRIATALETIAERLRDPDHALVERVAVLEEVLQDVVDTIVKPESSNEEWLELLAHAREVLP